MASKNTPSAASVLAGNAAAAPVKEGARVASAAERAEIRSLDRSIFRGHLRMALMLFVGMLVVYLCGTVSFAIEGTPAKYVADISNLSIHYDPRQFVWVWALRTIQHLWPDAYALPMNVLSAVFSAATVSLLFLAVAQLIANFIDVYHLRNTLDPKVDIRRFVALVSNVGGVAAALALGFSAPYWFTSAQVWPYAFHLGLFLIGVVLLMRFHAHRPFLNLTIFCVFWGFGLSQAPSFLAWTPVILAYLVFRLWQDDAKLGEVLPRILVLILVPFALALVLEGLAFWHSPGYFASDRNLTFAVLLWRMFKLLVDGVTGSIPKVWWMVLVGLTILPCLASLITARRALNGMLDFATCFLHFAIALTTILVMLDLRFSPWQFYNVSLLQIVPYAMMSFSFGYIVAFLLANITILLQRKGSTVPFAKIARLRAVVLVFAVALLGYTVYNNFDDADMRGHRFVQRYVNTLLDGLQGRTWLVTNGVFDYNLRIGAAERKMPLHIINLSQQGRHATDSFKKDLPNIRLKNVSDIGLLPLVKEWIGTREDAKDMLALTLVPDFWHMGPYDVLPSGLSFLGDAPAAVLEYGSTQDLVPSTLATIDAFEKDLALVPEDAYPLLKRYAEIVQRNVSFVANNTGFLLETSGREEDSFAIYKRIRTFDKDNISALLNWATYVQRHGTDDEKTAVLNELKKFQNARNAPPSIWVLSTTYGYVADPTAFARIGWTWALSGQSNLAVHSLKRAIEKSEGAQRQKLRELLASVYMQSGDLETSRESFLAILEEDPGDPTALLSLVRISALSGDLDEARKFLQRAEEAGVPHDRVLYETVALLLAAGNLDEAYVLAMQLVEISAEDPASYVVLSSILGERYRQEKDEALREELLRRMRKNADKLIERTGVENGVALLVRARVEEYENRFAEARDDYRYSLKYLNAGTDVMPILESILRLDFRLADKSVAERDARAILFRDPENAFANYILGSLATSVENFESAEDYLERSYARNPYSIATVNDLAMAKLGLRKFEEAEKLAREAIALNDNLSAAWDTLGCVLYAKKEDAAAREALDKAVQIDNDSDIRIHLHLAMVLLRQGEVGKAREIANKLLPLSGQFKGADERNFRDLTQELIGIH